MKEVSRERHCRTITDDAIGAIKRESEKKGLSMADIAESSRVPYVNITRMFSGSYRRVITLRTLVALADAIGFDLELRLRPRRSTPA